MTLRGVEDVNRLLTQIAPREGINLMQATVGDISKQLAQSAASKTPDDPASGAGDLKSNIKSVRKVMGMKSRGRVKAVRNNVRTVASAAVVVTNIKRNYFWRFLEYGQGPDNIEWAMFLKALQEMRPNMERVYLEAFAKKLVARLARMKKG